MNIVNCYHNEFDIRAVRVVKKTVCEHYQKNEQSFDIIKEEYTVVFAVAHNITPSMTEYFIMQHLFIRQDICFTVNNPRSILHPCIMSVLTKRTLLYIHLITLQINIQQGSKKSA